MNKRKLNQRVSLLLVVSLTLTLFTGLIGGRPETAEAAPVKIVAEADAMLSSKPSEINTNFSNPANNQIFMRTPLPEDLNNLQYSIMRFDVSSIPDNATEVKLKLFFTAQGPGDVGVYAVANDSWVESGEGAITWSNKPDHGQKMAQFMNITGTAFNQVDITEYVLQQKALDGKASIMLIGDSGAYRQVYTREREWDQKPHLEITIDTAAPVLVNTVVSAVYKQIDMNFNEPILATNGATLKDQVRLSRNDSPFAELGADDSVAITGNKLTITLNEPLVGGLNKVQITAGALKDAGGNATTANIVTGNLLGADAPVPEPVYENGRSLPASADAQVDSGAGNANSNFGTNTTMSLKEGGGEYNRRIYMKFDLSDVNMLNSALLRVFFTSTAVTGNDPLDPVKVYAVADNWSESGAGSITYNTQPVIGDPIGTASVNGAPGWYEWDITSYINGQKSGDKIASLVIIGTGTGANRVAVARESASNQPHLLLNYDEVPPVLNGGAVSQKNKRIELLFDGVVHNNKADLTALRNEISLARIGGPFTSLSGGDSVLVEQNKLIIQLENRLSEQGAKIKINSGALKDTAQNVTLEALVSEALAYDTTAPVLNAGVRLNESQQVAFITANEPLFRATANDADLKTAVTFAADGADFKSLGAGDTVRVLNGELEVAFASKLTGDQNRIRIASHSVEDAAGNVQATTYTSAPIIADSTPPELVQAYTINRNKKIVLAFNKSIVSQLTDESDFKNALKLSSDGGVTYRALGANDSFKASGSTITVSVESPVSGSVNRIKLEGGAIKDLAGNVLQAELITGNIAAADTKYPFAPPRQSDQLAALTDAANIRFGNLDGAQGSAIEEKAGKAFSVLAETIASGNRDPQYIDLFVSSVKRMITTPEYMPNLQAGLDSRGHSFMLYGLALMWDDKEIMARFNDDDRSKLDTFLRAALISSAYTVSDYDHAGSRRPGNRPAMNGDMNTWIGTGVNYWEPNLTLFYSAALMLGLENVDGILKSYKHSVFIEELHNQGLTEIEKAFRKTTNFSTAATEELRLEEKAAKVEGTIKSNLWSFKGVTMQDMLENPMKMHAATQKLSWTHPAQDGDYLGQMGMAHEFDTVDAMGSRQSAMYVARGIDPSLVNRVIMAYYGFWDAPGNEELADTVGTLQSVGVSDYYAKVTNGFYSQSSYEVKTEYITSLNYAVNTMLSLGLINPALWNDTFNYSALAPMSNHWMVEGGQWDVVKDSIIPYNTKNPLSNFPNAVPVDPNETLLYQSNASNSTLAYSKRSFGNVNYHAWLKAEAGGEAGILIRVKDKDNYYRMSYGNGKLSIAKVEDGVAEVLEETTYAWSADKAYRFRAVAVDNELSFYVNGELQLTAEDNTIAQGAVGLYSSGAKAKFDGILVQNAKLEAPNLEPLTVGNGQLSLRYGSVPGATMYRVQYGTAPGVYSNELITSSNTPVISGLTNDTTYYVVVTAAHGSQESARSSERSMMPRVPTAAVPTLTSVIADGGHVRVNFTTDAINTAYTIKYGLNPGNYTHVIEDVPGSGHVIALPISQVPYYFVVEGNNDYGPSVPSNEVQSSGNGTQLFDDNFNDGEYATDWVLSTGSPVMEEGRIKTGGGDPERLWLKQGSDWKDYVITTKFELPSQDVTKDVGVLARVNTSANYYVAGYKYDKAAGTEKVTFRRKVNNGFLPDIAVDFELNKNVAEHTLKASFNGDEIKIYIDDVLAYETIDTSLTKGTVGIFSVKTPVYFDDFKVELLNGLQKPVIAEAKASGTKATVTFNEIADTTGYKIKYGTHPRAYSNQLTVSGYSENGVELTGLTPGATYYVTVSGFNAKLESENASEVEVKVPSTPVVTPDPGPTPNPGNGSIPGSGAQEPVIKDGVAVVKPVVSGQQAKAAMASDKLDNLFGQASAGGDGVKRGVIEIASVSGISSYAQQLPAAWFEAGNGSKRLAIRTAVGTIELSDEMLSSVNLNGVSSVEIVVESGDTAQLNEELRGKIGNRPVVELQVLVDGKRIAWDNNRAPVTVSIDYVPTAEERLNPEHIVVWYIDGIGNAVSVPSGRYDAATGKVSFTTNHFSSYAVAYEFKTFADIQQLGWAKKQIEVLASKGIINGTSATTFNPHASVTRADFLRLLIDALGISADVESNFDDVAPTDYYYQAAGIAKALGISNGVGGNKLNPKGLISRQDMMVMVERAMVIAGKNLDGTQEVDPARFQDASAVAGYAKNSVSILLRNGLVEGDGEHLNPTGHTTRAQAAVLLYRVYNR
jgi:hypothetical protein